MGVISTEQTVAIIEATKSKSINPWWLLLIAIIPPLIGGICMWLTRKYGKEFK